MQRETNEREFKGEWARHGREGDMEACRRWPDRLYGLILPNNSHGPGRRRRRNDDDEEAENVVSWKHEQAECLFA